MTRLIGIALIALAGASLAAQRPALSDAVRAFVKVDAPVVALVHARVIDGTGAPPREGQTLVLRDGAHRGHRRRRRNLPRPTTRWCVDLAGQTVMPGLVMLHEHLYYPVGPGSTASSARASPGSTSPAG